MGRKRNPVLPLFTRDIESSPKVNALSPEATGLYFRLLCRFNEPPRPGSLALHDWEMHPNWQRSLTQQCLSNPDKYKRLEYFAKFISRKVLTWKSSVILKGLQELYFYGIIVVEGDAIIQPRMYKDNGFELQNGTMTEAAEEVLEKYKNGDENNSKINGTKSVPKTVQKSDEKSTEKSTKKNRVIHAHAHSKEIEKENNINNNNDRNNIIDSKTRKNGKFAPPSLEDVTTYCQEKGYTFNPEKFWSHYETNGWVQGKGKPIKSWKACCTTWQLREQDGEFGGNRGRERQGSIGTKIQKSDVNFDDQDTW